MPKGSLIYSAEACDACRCSIASNLSSTGGAEGKLEEAVVECAEELVTTRSTQREGQPRSHRPLRPRDNAYRA
jgi:hypothetical protein